MRYLTASLLLAISPVVVGAIDAPTQESAWQARLMLGEGVWAKVLRIENDNPASPYPATVYATVFEMGGILWFYTGMDGTQSFSLHRGRVEEEKGEMDRLLRAIEPGFKRHDVLPDAMPVWAHDRGPLRNGCFINSLVALRDALEHGVPIKQARLLTYYLKRRGGVVGHTVLVYQTDLGLHVVDGPDKDSTPVFLHATDDGLELARRLLPSGQRHRLVTTRWFELISPAADADTRADWLVVVGGPPGWALAG
jgi:hypothetical protein